VHHIHTTRLGILRLLCYYQLLQYYAPRRTATVSTYPRWLAQSLSPGPIAQCSRDLLPSLIGSSHLTNLSGLKTAHVKTPIKGKAVTVQAMKDIRRRGWGWGGRRDDSYHSQTRYLPSGHFTPGKLLPVLAKREAGWDPKPVLKYYCPCLGVEP